MMRFAALLTVAAVTSVCLVSVAHGHGLNDRRALRMARTMSWHGPYYHAERGMPVPLVVPPTAHMQTRWSWGVSQGTMTPIYHQFWRGAGAAEFGGMDLRPTPARPSHTDQFGVYYIRGPW